MNDKPTNKITIELDVNELFSAKDKERVFKSAIDNRIGSRDFIEELKGDMLTIFLKDGLHEEMAKKFKKQLSEYVESWTPEQMQTKIEAERYKISELVRKVIGANEEIVEKPVLEYLITKDFSKIIGKMVEDNLTRNITDRLDLRGSCDED